jgi:hypothetical protein
MKPVLEETKKVYIGCCVATVRACSKMYSMSLFSYVCNALHIRFCYTDECEVIHEESLLIAREEDENGGSTATERKPMLPCFHLTERQNSQSLD